MAYFVASKWDKPDVPGGTSHIAGTAGSRSFPMAFSCCEINRPPVSERTQDGSPIQRNHRAIIIGEAVVTGKLSRYHMQLLYNIRRD